jgi:Domain of unknown function (DUF4440)
MKIVIAGCALALLSLGSVTIAWADTSSAATEKAIVALENKWSQVETDNKPDLIEPFLSAKAVFTDSEGKVTDRGEFLMQERATKFTSSTVDAVKVTVFGNTAIASYLLTQKGTDKNGAFDRQMQETDTWVKMPNGAWQVVASHSSTLKKT